MVALTLGFMAGEMTELLSTSVVLPTVVTLIGLGLLVVYAMRDRVDANWAKGFFLAAAGYWMLKVIMWGSRTSHSFGFRFFASFAAFGLAGAFLVESFRLIAAKHKEQQAKPTTTENSGAEKTPISEPASSANVNTVNPHPQQFPKRETRSAPRQAAPGAINQTMTNSPSGIQAGRDVTIGQKPSPTATQKDKKP